MAATARLHGDPLRGHSHERAEQNEGEQRNGHPDSGMCHDDLLVQPLGDDQDTFQEQPGVRELEARAVLHPEFRDELPVLRDPVVLHHARDRDRVVASGVRV